MRTLWMVSVGVTDIQFPAWRQDDAGAWVERSRIDIGRSPKVRPLHEALLDLYDKGLVRLCKDVPPPVREQTRIGVEAGCIEVGSDVVFEARLSPGSSATSDRSPPMRISAFGEAVPNERDEALTLFFPKIVDMLPAVGQAKLRGSLIVVVLNTCRNIGPDKDREPIASGPLCAAFIAEQLQLSKIVGGARLPEVLPDNVTTWLDILQGDERLESEATETLVLGRLNELLDSFKAAEGDVVLVSASGGLPPLKPVIERIPATRLGDSRVFVLDNPEGPRKGVPEPRPLLQKWTEREALRFQCAQALRECDFAGAYGVARRAPTHAWAKAALALTGPLLELRAPADGQRPLADLALHELRAARVEAAVAMADLASAVRYLHTFLESALWTALGRSLELSRLGLIVSFDSEAIEVPQGVTVPDALAALLEPKGEGAGRLRPVSTLQLTQLPQWLAGQAREDARLREAARCLSELGSAYRRRSRPHIPDSTADVPNRLSHGAGEAVDMSKLKSSLVDRGILRSTGAEPLGMHFLGTDHVEELLTGLTIPGKATVQSRFVKAYRDALHAVARGA